MLATSRWANLPVSVANHATREEEASACERIASGAWLPVSAMWGGFPIGGYVAPDVLDAIADDRADTLRELEAAQSDAVEASHERDALLAEIDRAVDLLETISAESNWTTIDAAVQGAVNILLDRS